MAKDDKKRKKKEKKNSTKPQREQEEENILLPDEDNKRTKKKKPKFQHEEEEKVDRHKPRAKQHKKNSLITDARFASAHSDPRFQRVPKKESKVPIDSRFARMLSDKSFSSSSAPVDKRGKLKKGKEVNPLIHYYHQEEEKAKEEEESDDGSETEVSAEEEGLADSESGGDPNSSTDEDDDDDDEQCLVNSDICQYLMASHEDTPLTEQETHRLAVVNMDWDHIKAVDLYVVMSSCLPKVGQILSVGIYPSEFGLKCMEVEAVHGPSGLLDNNEEHSDDEPEINPAKLRTYELNKLRYYYGVVVCDSSATANHIYKTLDGTELLSTSNVFDLRFIPDSMEFNHPPRDITTEAPTSYKEPDFHTRALQHTEVKLTWEEDEPHRTKILRRKFNPDQLDELNEYLASSGESDDGDENEGESDGSENDNAATVPNGEAKKHMDREKLRALLLSEDGSGTDQDNDNDLEITFNTGLEDLSKRILEKKDKKSETVWEQVLRKRSEKKAARKKQSKHSSEDDSSDFDAQEAPDQPDDFFMEEESLDLNSQVSNQKNKDLVKSKGGKSSRKRREESPDIGKEQEASRAELELLFAEDQEGKNHGLKGYNLKPKKVKGKKGKEVLAEDKLPNVDISDDPRFSSLFTSHLFALDPTDPQFKRSAAYARQQSGKLRTVGETEEEEETMNPSELQMSSNDLVPIEKEKHELTSTVRSLKRNLGSLRKGPKAK